MKIQLDQEEENAIANIMKVSGPGASAIKKLFSLAEQDLSNIMNIDKKGNMGLQALAAQNSVENLRGIIEVFFPEIKGMEASVKGKAISKWR